MNTIQDYFGRRAYWVVSAMIGGGLGAAVAYYTKSDVAILAGIAAGLLTGFAVAKSRGSGEL